MATTVIALTAIALGVLLYAHARTRPRLAFAAKAAASVAFVLLGLARWRAGAAVDTWLVAGLVLGLVGDLLLRGRRTFDAGLVAFLLGHLAYVAAFILVLPVTAWPAWPLLVLGAAAAAVTRWLWPRLGRRRVPVAVYIAAISTMLWGAVSAAMAGQVPLFTALGALLFYLSDLAVARERFVEPSFTNRLVGLPLYYAGQILIAMTVGL